MSFNSIFGLGSHSPDASLESHWLLQETTGTTAADRINGRDLAINGMGSNPITTTGPNSWIPSAFVFDGVDDYLYNSSAGVAYNETMSVGCLFQYESATGSFSRLAEQGANDEWSLVFKESGFDLIGVNRNANISSVYAGASLSSGTVYHVVLTIGSDTTVRMYIDGALVSTSTTGAMISGARNLEFTVGRFSGGSNYGKMPLLANFYYFSRDLSLSEVGESTDGPEPVVTSGSDSISGTEQEGDTLSVSGATWGLPSPFSGGSNGTITYSYQWTRSDDGSGTGEANISGATSATYVPVSGDVGKYLRRITRGTNDGGYDVAADAASNFSGAISAAGGGGATLFRRSLSRRVGSRGAA